jgi:long-chain acyl-CoA synthetase
MDTPVDFDQMPTLGAIAVYHARERPRAIALAFEGRQTDFAEFDRRTNQVAQALLARGITHGRRICYVGKNSDHYFELLFGAAKIGVVMTPIGWRLAAVEIAYIVEDAEAALAFVGPEVLDRVVQAVTPNHELRLIALEPGDHGMPLYETWRDAAAKSAPPTDIDPNDVAVQLYTAGTTGRPKGAMLTHHNILARRRMWIHQPIASNTWEPDDISLLAMPVAHIGGTGWGISGLLHGAKSVVARDFNAHDVLDFIERDRISKMFMVPAALQIVVRDPRARQVDFSRLKYILYGSSPITLDLLRECMEVFGCGFCQQYGMTETCGTIVYLPPEDHDPAGNPRMRAAGLPFPGVELKIVDESGKALPPHGVGEVVTRSTSNIAGYWKLPDVTATVIDEEGWLRTGDAGYLDDDGYLYILDRIKDMIISGAENIYPAEVETAIYGHPDVAEVAVIGVPDETWGEAVKAMVVPKAGTHPEPADIIAFARTRIAGFKAPKSVEFIDALPRNAAGKILRRILREPFWAGRERGVN